MTDPFIPSVAEPQDFVSPLIHFKGVLKEHKSETRVPDEGGKARLSVTFNFVDITVIESREPYAFPIATLKLPYSDRSATRWAAFTKSFRSLVPKEAYGSPDPLSVLDGKEVEMRFQHARLRLPLKDDDGEDTGKWAEQDGEAWQLVSVEGFGSAGEQVAMTDLIVDFADGKKDSDIYQWIYTEQSLKNQAGYMEALEAVGERTLLTTLVTAGKLTVDADGVYHKAG